MKNQSFICIMILLFLTSCFKINTKDKRTKYKPPTIIEQNLIEKENTNKADHYKTVKKDGTLNKINSKLNPKIINHSSKETINNQLDKLIIFINKENFSKLSQLIHPKKGVRFHLYSQPNLNDDLLFNKDEIKEFASDNKKYIWGYEYFSYKPIKLTKMEFFNQYLKQDFSKTTKTGFNEVITYNGDEETQFLVYPDTIIVEYYFPNVESKNDWFGYRVIFEEYNNNWYIIAFSRSFWTY